MHERFSHMRTLSLCLAIALIGCGTDSGAGDDVPDDVLPTGPEDPLDGLPTGTTQWEALCANGYTDMISTKFCAGATPPTLTSIKDLQNLLGLDPNSANARVTLTGLSTGLGLRNVTQLNPRAFVMTTPSVTAPNPTYQVMAFARGEPLVELVAKEANGNLRFFLLRFQPACEQTHSCTNADMFTPTIESGWTGYSLYDDTAIRNTTLDCLNCHQTSGPGTQKILRMQELANPWAHWFYIERPTNKALIMDFHAAHGTEDYAGIPWSLVDPSRPLVMQRLVTNNGFGTQPNQFDTTTIQTEMTMSGQSATWNTLYMKSVQGLEIPTPYFATHTDPTKVAAMISSYQQVMAGTLARAQLPDISDTFLDAALPDMSIRPKAGLDGKGVIAHMCTMCHNSRLDQTISRAQFNAESLAQMSRTEKDQAIARMMLPETDARHMPPARFHVLSDAERDLVIDELSQ